MRATRTLRRLCFAETRGVFKPQVPVTARAFPEGADVRPETENLKVAPSLVPGAGKSTVCIACVCSLEIIVLLVR